jgi:hypothetical protein
MPIANSGVVAPIAFDARSHAINAFKLAKSTSWGPEVALDRP